MNTQTKQRELDKIAREIENCVVCQQDKIGKAVVGEGSADADVVFIGEAPGRQEAESGRPFIGRSGQLLRSLIREIGLSEEEVYITSPVKYLPRRGTPSKQEVAHGRVHLEQQLKIIDPKIIVLLGKVAALGVLGEEVFVTKDHGKLLERDGRHYFITFHPAAALRMQKFKPFLIEDFQKLKELL